MPRPRNPEPSAPLTLKLPESERARLDLLLWSEAEGRVPQGEYLLFFRRLLAGFFSSREADFSSHLGKPQGTHLVRGPEATLQALGAALKERS